MSRSRSAIVVSAALGAALMLGCMIIGLPAADDRDREPPPARETLVGLWVGETIELRLDESGAFTVTSAVAVPCLDVGAGDWEPAAGAAYSEPGVSLVYSVRPGASAAGRFADSVSLREDDGPVLFAYIGDPDEGRRCDLRKAGP